MKFLMGPVVNRLSAPFFDKSTKESTMLIFTNLPANEGDTGLRLYLYSPETGNLLNTGGSILTEVSSGVFMGEVPQAILADMRADVENAQNVTIASDWLYLGNSVVGLKATEEEPQPVYYNTVRRNSDDSQPIYFEWVSDAASITCEVSINGGPFQASSGGVSYHRTEYGAYLYKVNYHSDDRPLEGTAEYKVTDGAIERIIPMTIDSSNLDTGQYSLLIVAEDLMGNRLQNARVYINDTTISGYTGTTGELRIALDDGTYEVSVMPPAGYGVPASQTVVVNGTNPDPITFVLQAGCGTVPWI